jgi:hypothetical protein
MKKFLSFEKNLRFLLNFGAYRPKLVPGPMKLKKGDALAAPQILILKTLISSFSASYLCNIDHGSVFQSYCSAKKAFVLKSPTKPKNIIHRFITLPNKILSFENSTILA